MLQLATGRVLLMDGAMGTELQKAGARPGDCLEAWNLTYPERVQSIHQAYAGAGAEILVTNTFQANPTSLARHGLSGKTREICQTAVALARSVPSDHWVLGSVGPMPDYPGGLDFPNRERLLESALGLKEADGILLETCSDWSAWQAAQWLNEATVDCPILISFALRLRDNEIETWDGHRPGDFAEPRRICKVAALGVNCGVDQDVARMAETIRHWRSFTKMPLFARPNAGTPAQVQDGWIYPHSPEQMGAALSELLDSGLTMIGGCCGTTPAHIAAFRRRLSG